MIFGSADHALRWAYETSSRPIVKLSSINGMRGSQSSISDLTPHDRHAQAALILGMVERLDDPAGRECIAAKYYCLRPEEVPYLMLRAAAALGTGVHNKRAVYQFVRGYFGERVGYRTVRKMLGCRDTEALEIRARIFDALDYVHDRAMAEIENRMEIGGLLSRERVYAL